MGKKRPLLRQISSSNHSKESNDTNQKFSRKQRKKQRLLALSSQNSSKRLGENQDNDGKDDEDDEIDEEDSDEDEEENGAISLNTKQSEDLEEFTFEFYDMKESFVESITSLLKGIFINPTLSYELACGIVTQDAVGTAVLCEGGEDVFAFATLLSHSTVISSPMNKFLNDMMGAIETNLSRHKEIIKEFNDSIKGVRAESVGIMIHKQYPNFPLQLIHPLYNNLYEDIQWIKLQPQSQSQSQSSSDINVEDKVISQLQGLTHILVLSTCSLASGSNISDNCAIVLDRSVMYDEFEDEIFLQNSITTGIAYKPMGIKTIFCAGIMAISSFKDSLKEIYKMCPPLLL